jgi:hypothetical protein
MGFIVIIHNSKYHIIRNKYNNHEQGLGFTLNNHLKLLVDEDSFGVEKLKRLLNSMNWVSQTISPRDEEIERLRRFSSDMRSIIRHTWSTLLQKTHGSLLKILECGYCEAIIVNEEKFRRLQATKYQTLSFYEDMDDEYEYIIDVDNQYFKGRTIGDGNIFWNVRFNNLKFMDSI